MHAKNANFFEQHVEKIILAVGAVVAIVIVFIYVLGEPYSVELGGQEAAPSGVAECVEKPLKALDIALNNSNAPADLDITMAPRSQWFSQRQSNPASGTMAMTNPFGGSQGLDKSLLNAERQAQERYVLPPLPGPSGVLARADHAVLLENDELEEIFAQPDFILEGMQVQEDMHHGREVAAQYGQMVSLEAPRDFQYVSVMAEFDWEQWRKALEEATGSARLPVEWWQHRTFFVDVILERQVWNDTVDAWGADEGSQFVEDGVERVPLLPGSMNFRAPAAGVNPRELRARVALPLVQQQIMQPPFAPIEGGWLRPDEQPKQRDAKEERRLMTIDEQIRNLERRQQDLVRKMMAEAARKQDRAEANRQREARDRRTESTRREGSTERRSSRTTTGLARGGATAAVPRKTQAQRTQEAHQELTDKLDKLHLERDVLTGLIDEEEARAMEEEQKETKRQNRTARTVTSGTRRQTPGGFADPRMGGMPMDPGMVGMGMMGPGGMGGAAGMPFGPGMAGPGMMGSMGRDPRIAGYGSQHFRGAGARIRGMRRNTGGEGQAVPEASTKVAVWAHDVTGVPGAQYRYRLRAAVYNPLFQKHDRLIDELDAVADALGWISEPSAWSETIQIHPRSYFFLVGGNKRVAAATIEIYRIFNGHWQREEFEVQPGDTVGGKRRLKRGGVEREVDLSLGVLVVDIDPHSQSQIRATRQTVKLIYLDVEENALQDRTAESDSEDPTRMKLYNKTKFAQEVDELARADER